jgi:hypothetical protein
MDKPVLTQEQINQINNFKFTIQLLEQDYPISDIFRKLSDKIPNNYDFGAIVREIVINTKTNKIF